MKNNTFRTGLQSADSMSNNAFIERNKNADVRAIALGKIPADVDLHYCLQQIEGRQIAQRKLPSWAESDNIIYPAKLSLEQCSSEQTALYKQQLVARLLPTQRDRMADLTGGFGIDFSMISRIFPEADYVERNEQLCKAALHNFMCLGLSQARVHQTTCEEFLDGMGQYSLVYLDPARRDAAGRKVTALSDCSPNVEALWETLTSHAQIVIVKLSPMLDIQDTLRRLHSISEVHVVSLEGECKEVLMVYCGREDNPVFHCVNIAAPPQTFCTNKRDVKPTIATYPERYLYEPNASILKAGVQDALCQAFDVRKLHPFSHLFTSEQIVTGFPGRIFRIEDSCGFAKKDLKRFLADIDGCNLTIRNFPATVAQLRKQLKLKEGADCHLFATTLSDGTHTLLRCKLP